MEGGKLLQFEGIESDEKSHDSTHVLQACLLLQWGIEARSCPDRLSKLTASLMQLHSYVGY